MISQHLNRSLTLCTVTLSLHALTSNLKIAQFKMAQLITVSMQDYKKHLGLQLAFQLVQEKLEKRLDFKILH